MTAKKLAANRRNALKSTGPRTPEGKRSSSMNAVKHGLRAVSLAVPILENPEDWEAHRALVISDLAPSGYLETILSERVAALLWRLGRVVRYESEVVSIAMKREAEGTSYRDTETLESLKEGWGYLEEDEKVLHRVHALKGKARVSGEDASRVLGMVAEFLEVDIYGERGTPVSITLPGVPDDPEVYWEDFAGWTRDLVDAGVREIAAHAEDFSPKADPWVLVLAHAHGLAEKARERYEARTAEVECGFRQSLLPRDEVLDKVTRYETHLERSLFRTLHELQRLQAARSGVGLLPPSTLDMEVCVSRETV